MRHRKGYKKLGRDTAHRSSLMRNLASSIVTHESVTTTLSRAKAIRGEVEKLVTLGKRGDLHARRQVASYLYDNDAARKVFVELAPRFKERPGGYLRILRRGVRFGDGAKMATIQFVDYKPGEKSKD